MLLAGRQEGHPACKKYGEDGGGGHWLVRMEWRPAGWSVCLPLLIFPRTIKSRSSLLAPAHMDGPRKRAVKWLWHIPYLLYIYMRYYLKLVNHLQLDMLQISNELSFLYNIHLHKCFQNDAAVKKVMKPTTKGTIQ